MLYIGRERIEGWFNERRGDFARKFSKAIA